MEEEEAPEKVPWYKNRIVCLLILYFFVRSIRADTSYTQEHLRIIDLDTVAGQQSGSTTCDPLGPAYLTYVQGKTQLFQLLFYVLIILAAPQLGLVLSIALDLGSYLIYLLLKEALFFTVFRKISVLQFASCFLGISLGTSNLIHSQIYSLVSQSEYHKISGLTRGAGTVGHMLGSAFGGLFLGFLYTAERVFIRYVVQNSLTASATFEKVYNESSRMTWHTLGVVHFVIVASSIASTLFSFLIGVFINRVVKRSETEKGGKQSERKRPTLTSNLETTMQQFRLPSVMPMSIAWSLNLVSLLLIRIWASSLWTATQQRLNCAPMNGFASILSYIASLLGSSTPPLLLKRISPQRFLFLQTWLFLVGGVLAVLQSVNLGYMPVYYITSALLDYVTWTCGAFLANELAKKVARSTIKPFFNLLYIFVYSLRMVIVWYISGFGRSPPININNRFLLIALLLFSTAVVNVAIRIEPEQSPHSDDKSRQP